MTAVVLATPPPLGLETVNLDSLNQWLPNVWDGQRHQLLSNLPPGDAIPAPL